MRRTICGLICILFATLASLPAVAQDVVVESSTKVQFPKLVEFQYDGEDYELALTGLAVRKKFVFKVYGIAHYMDTAAFESEDAAYAAALSDGPAKQITMEFVRDVEVKKIQNAFREGFEKHASSAELQEITGHLDAFVELYDVDVVKGDQYVLRWLPGGIVIAVVGGEQKSPITNVAFATVLWRIWLDDGSIVDRDRLVELVVPD